MVPASSNVYLGVRSVPGSDGTDKRRIQCRRRTGACMWQDNSSFDGTAQDLRSGKRFTRSSISSLVYDATLGIWYQADELLAETASP